MRKYLIMPERCSWDEVEATSAEMAYSAVCCWYRPSQPVAVLDIETGKTVIFTRKLDEAGNLVNVEVAK